MCMYEPTVSYNCEKKLNLKRISAEWTQREQYLCL